MAEKKPTLNRFPLFGLFAYRAAKKLDYPEADARLLGYSTAIPMIVSMTVAILSTEIPILLGHGYWKFNLPKVNQYGFWAMAHEARTDFSMILGSIFLLIVGAGSLSIDALICRSRKTAHP